MQNMCKTSDFSFLFWLILTFFTHHPIRPFLHSDEKNHSPSQNPNTPKPSLTVKRLNTLLHSDPPNQTYQAPSSNDNEIVIEFLKKMKRLKSSEAENNNTGRSCLIERGSSEHEIVSRAFPK